MVNFSLSPKLVTPPPSEHLGLSLSNFAEKVVYKATKHILGSLGLPDPLPPSYLGLSPEIYDFLLLPFMQYCLLMLIEIIMKLNLLKVKIVSELEERAFPAARKRRQSSGSSKVVSYHHWIKVESHHHCHLWIKQGDFISSLSSPSYCHHHCHCHQHRQHHHYPKQGSSSTLLTQSFFALSK